MPRPSLDLIGAGAVLAGLLERSDWPTRVVSRRGYSRMPEVWGDLVLYAACVDERSFTMRSQLAQANLGLLADLLGPWAERPVLVLTNPVELICHRIWQATGNARVYGFGMRSDRQRWSEILGRPVEEVSGFHAFGPVLPEMPDASWQERLEEHTRREFVGDKPPVARAAANLPDFLDDWARGRPVEVSGLSRLGGEDCFLGGWLRGEEFRVPDWAARHPVVRANFAAYRACL